MHKSPLVLGADTRKVRGYPFADALEAVGYNTGNLIFSEALYRSIEGAVRSEYNFEHADLEGRDAIVVSAANWINDFVEFEHLFKILEATKLPVYAVGLGAQTDDMQTLPKLKPYQEKLMRLFADRGVKISVRGAFSAEVLGHYGIKNVEVTGCPSLLLSAPRPTIRNADNPTKITFHGTRHYFEPGTGQNETVFEVAISNKYDLVLQSELAEAYYATQRFDNPDLVKKSEEALPLLYPGRPIEETKAYLAAHAKIFFDLGQWIYYLSTRDFVVGTRIHGTIAALLAGTRALLLTHDSRTEELADTMNVPSMPLRDFAEGGRRDINDLYHLAEPGQYITGFTNYRSRFIEFLRANSLSLNNA
jgi:hypothetical protein